VTPCGRHGTEDNRSSDGSFILTGSECDRTRGKTVPFGTTPDSCITVHCLASLRRISQVRVARRGSGAIRQSKLTLRGSHLHLFEIGPPTEIEHRKLKVFTKGSLIYSWSSFETLSFGRCDIEKKFRSRASFIICGRSRPGRKYFGTRFSGAEHSFLQVIVAAHSLVSFAFLHTDEFS